MKSLSDYLRQKKGTSIVELILYMGLLMILLGVFTQIFSMLMEVQLENQSKSAFDQDSQFIRSRVMYDIKRADNVILPSQNGDSSSTLVLTIDGQTYTYALDGNNLTLASVLGTDNLNSSQTSVSNLSFVRLGNAKASTISVFLHLTSVVEKASGPKEGDINLTVGVRQE